MPIDRMTFSRSSRAVFFDRDGTIIEDRDYLNKPEDVRFIPGACEALKEASDAGYRLIMVTNQSGVGRGYFTMEDVARVHAHICSHLRGFGVVLDGIHVAPEAPDQPSRGRKPSPAFLLESCDQFGLDMSACFMVGDKLIDLEAGWNAGVGRSILVRTGYGAKVEAKDPAKLDRAWVVDDFGSAVRRILEGTRCEKVVGIIPARFASTRFPGKPLKLIAGRPLIEHVILQCQKARSLSEVVVATDDARIAEAAGKWCRVEMTSPDHPSGTDRIAEAAARLECDVVLNIQGDEPLIDPAVINSVAGALQGVQMSTAATALKSLDEFDNPNVVKVVVSSEGRALYFSRRTIPYLRDSAGRCSPAELAAFPFLKHLGIYGYRRETLDALVRLPVSKLENAEKLEQLRALENGISIAVARVESESIGVDTPEDVARVEAILKR